MPLWAVIVTAVVALALGAAVGGIDDEDADEVASGAAESSDDLTEAHARIVELEAQLELVDGAADGTEDDEPGTTEPEVPAAEEGADEPDTSDDLGSRSEPVPAGEAHQVGEWEIAVVGVNRDAAGALAAENMFNDPPDPGRRYVMAELSATYRGDDEASSIGFSISFELVGDSNVAYTYSDRCGVTPNGLDSFRDVFRDGTISGNECWSVLEEDLGSLVLIVEPSGFRSTRTFFALPAD